MTILKIYIKDDDEESAEEIYQNIIDKDLKWVYKGKWQADMQYHCGDVVSYKESIMVCIKDHFSNHYIKEDINNWAYDENSGWDFDNG